MTRIERVSLMDKNEEGKPERTCDWCDSIYNKDTENYDKPARDEGYRIGYTTVCKSCLNAVYEGKNVLDKTKHIKSVEV